MANAGPALPLKKFVDFKVGGIEGEDAVGRVPVAPCASGLLHVLLERARRLVVQDVADDRARPALRSGNLKRPPGGRSGSGRADLTS